jgi:DNA-directed RNA polymerase beta subunit
LTITRHCVHLKTAEERTIQRLHSVPYYESLTLLGEEVAEEVVRCQKEEAVVQEEHYRREAVEVDDATEAVVQGEHYRREAVEVDDATEAVVQGEHYRQEAVEVGDATEAVVQGEHCREEAVEVDDATEAVVQGEESRVNRMPHQLYSTTTREKEAVGDVREVLGSY